MVYIGFYGPLIVPEAISCTISEIEPSTCKTSLYLATLLTFNPDRGVPREDLHKMLHGGQRMAMMQNSVETLWKISTG